MNGDILLKIDPVQLFDFHRENRAFDMPELIDASRGTRFRTLAYPIQEY